MHMAIAGSKPKIIRKNVISLAGYFRLSDLASASTNAKQNIAARICVMLRSGTALLWAMERGIVIHGRKKNAEVRVAYHRTTRYQMMLLLTLLIKNDEGF
jgi:hypothetical protein